jgi:hypothetical protein
MVGRGSRQAVIEDAIDFSRRRPLHWPDVPNCGSAGASPYRNVAGWRDAHKPGFEIFTDLSASHVGAYTVFCDKYTRNPLLLLITAF